MDHDGVTSPKTGALVRVPLLVAFLATPLAVAASRIFEGMGELSLDAPWLVLAGLGGLLSLVRRPSSKSRTSGGMALFVGLAALGVYVMPQALATLHRWLPVLPEIRPLAYLLFCLLWAYTFGPPSRTDFQRYGALLGLMVLADIAAGEVLHPGWPVLRWLGDQEIIATMLLVALCAGLRTGSAGVRRLELGDGLAWARVLILLGLVGTMSRTGLFVAAWVYIFFGRGSALKRLPVVAGLCAALAVTVVLQSAVLEQGGQMVDIWSWSQGGSMFLDTPRRLLGGYPLDTPLILDVPPYIEHLWATVFGHSAVSGVLVNMVHPFWLRLTLGWGAGPALFVLFALCGLLIWRPTMFGAALTVTVIGQGLAAPLLFDPASAVVLCLALFPAFRLARGPVAVRRKPAQPGAAVAKPGDSDLEMRPL